jgi:tellurite resistance protein
MVARIFSDTKVEDAERNELKDYLGSGALETADVKAVFEDFVATTWKITMADGVVSDVEKERLVNIVKELGIAKEMLPAEWAAIVEGA